MHYHVPLRAAFSDSLPWLQNDSITIHHRFAGDYRVKLSISHALSQSTKLCVFEERVLEIVQTTKDLPEALATSGESACTTAYAAEEHVSIKVIGMFVMLCVIQMPFVFAHTRSKALELAASCLLFGSCKALCCSSVVPPL